LGKDWAFALVTFLMFPSPSDVPSGGGLLH